jgi:peptide/nickel transport system substrate-binding protein
MKRSFLRLLAISCTLLAVVAHSSSRPRYGGTARVLLHDRVNSLDPLAEEDHPQSRDRMAGLTFETLTRIDAQGRLLPRLARSWQPDPSRRVWTFRLRLADFHDGSPVTAADVIASLKAANPDWRSTAPDRQTVVIESASAVNHLPEMLALEKFAVVKRGADGTITGSGPYRLSEWQPGERALFVANEDYWDGRSYPDAIEFQMGSSLRDQLLQRQLGPYAAAELPFDGLRSLEQGAQGAQGSTTGQNVSLSRPADLLVLVFLQPDSGGSGRTRRAVDPRVRQALALSLNRAAISNVLLQRQGAPALGLLPQWLTGYEFLLAGTRDQDADAARKLVAGAGVGTQAPTVALAYDFSDATAKLIAERIAVDAREVGIKVQPYGETHVGSRSAQATMNADAVLLRLPLPSLEPSIAIAALVPDLGLDASTATVALGAARPEELFEVERKALETFRVIPVAHVKQALWLNNGAHNWQQLPSGAWDLDQMWVEGAR